MDAEIARAYDEWAAVYDTNDNATRDLDAVILRAQPFALTGATVVEIGCGTGKNTAWLAAYAERIVALDFSRNMIERARARVDSPHVRFIEHDVATPWPIVSASADLVTCNLVLEHLADLAPVFAEAARVLHDGGTLYVSELHPYRQLLGKQARFAHPESGADVFVTAYRRDVANFVGAGLAAGLRLANLSEPRDADASDETPPRLLTLTFAKQSP